MFKQTIAIAALWGQFLQELRIRPNITVLLIALLNALSVAQVVAQAEQQQTRTTQVRQSGPWSPPSFQEKQLKPSLLLRGSGMSYMRTVGLAPNANTRSRHRTARKITNTVGTIVGVVRSILPAKSDLRSQNLGASAIGTFLSRFCW